MPGRILAVLILLLLNVTANASAACVNRFLGRSEGPKQIMTLLSGNLTFQEAQALSAAINTHQKSPIEWLDDAGKTVARQLGELKVVRPMPVGCDGRSSGVVMVATFLGMRLPSGKLVLKVDGTSITFDQQAQ